MWMARVCRLSLVMGIGWRGRGMYDEGRGRRQIDV